jgi:hypothetical protein
MTIKNLKEQQHLDLLAKSSRTVGERYWVKCEDFRCMATADYDGKWKSFPSGEVLTSTVLSFWQGF